MSRFPAENPAFGKTLTLRGGAPGTQKYNFIKDVPIGRYTVTAVYKPTGKKLRVSNAWQEGEYADAVTVDFLGTESAVRSNSLGLGFTDK